LNADTISNKELCEIRKDMEEKDLEISAIGFYPNYLDPNEKESSEAKRYFIKVLELAKRMEVQTVATFVGRDPDKSVEDNFPAFRDIFSHFVDEAAKRGVRIAIENCPMVDCYHQRSYNLAHTPEIWEQMFQIIPADNFGLEIDPAHLIWQGIDYVQAVLDFGPRIFHAHAKDTEIRYDVLKKSGIYGELFGPKATFGHGWWRARTPGWGDVDWKKFITALLDVGYMGNLDIEHEDDVFAEYAALGAKVGEESDIVNNYSTEEVGLVMGFNTLKDIVPKK
jgi:sugar phosphate isomerase/epimerase